LNNTQNLPLFSLVVVFASHVLCTLDVEGTASVRPYVINLIEQWIFVDRPSLYITSTYRHTSGQCKNCHDLASVELLCS